MPRISHHEQLVENVRSLRGLRSAYERRCDPNVMRLVREGLVLQLEAAQDALVRHDEQVKAAPKLLEETSRRLAAAERELKTEDNKDLAKMMDTLAKARELQAQIEAIPGGLDALRAAGIIK